MGKIDSNVLQTSLVKPESMLIFSSILAVKPDVVWVKFIVICSMA